MPPEVVYATYQCSRFVLGSRTIVEQVSCWLVCSEACYALHPTVWVPSLAAQVVDLAVFLGPSL